MGFEVIESREQWNKAVESISCHDIYYTYEYCSSSAKLEKGNAKLFYYKTHIGTIIYPLIVREIESDYGEILFDMITPYGYGGPLIIGDKSILKNFRKEFCSYCKKENIITEIITFHPLLKNAIYMTNYCNLQYIRKTTAVNLTKALETIRSHYSKMNKRNIRKALKCGLTCRVVEKNFENTTTFLELYKETMDRNKADAFYYFDFDFIEQQLKDTQISKSHLLFTYHQEKVVSAVILLTTANLSHYHLGASRTAYLYLKPNNLIFDFMVEISKAKGCTYLHLGGGYEDNDNLFKYKSSFTNNNNYDYYIGEKIFDKKMYELLINEKKKHHVLKEKFFPKYRGIDSGIEKVLEDLI